MRQDPWECLASFIFSSNNNIKRITKGLQSLRANYGNFLCSIEITADSLEVYDGIPESNPHVYHLYRFPTPQELLERSDESQLRDLGMGYRAK